METVSSIFARYEAVRHRLPASPATPGPPMARIASLSEIAGQADAFVFDAFGVLNVGNRPIPGAAGRLDALRARGCAIRVLSNAASHGHGAVVQKFCALGLRLCPDEIITSRDATLAALPALAGPWGCIAAADDDLADIPGAPLVLGDAPAPYEAAAGFLFLSTQNWSPARQTLLEASLARHKRPVIIANADLVAPREGGFSLEPGHYGHLLADRGLGDVRFFGKPFGEVYAMVEASLPGIAPGRIVMCGDTLHTDILGAAARGWHSVLVTQDGLFAGADALAFSTRAGLRATWHTARI